MAIKRKKVDTALEKQVITGMIMSTRFLTEMKEIYKPALFELGFATIIAEWCLSFYATYEKAPKDNIEDLYFKWCKTDPDEQQVDYIGKFLGTLSDEYDYADKFNTDFVLDKAIKHFNIRNYKELSRGLNACVADDDAEAAEELQNEFRRVEKATCEGIDPFSDKEAVIAAFGETIEPVFKVPGRLGQLLNPELIRASLVSLVGVEKMGKTWWLMFLGMMARKSGCQVAFFQAGDMTQNQMVRRQQIYLAQKSDRAKYCQEMYVPVLDCAHNQDDSCNKKKRKCDFGIEFDEDGDFEFDPDYIPCTVCSKDKGTYAFKGAAWYKLRPACKPLHGKEAYAISVAHNKATRAKPFKLATYPNTTLNVSGIKRQLETWERLEGFVPDVIICDYPDIFAPEKSNVEFRHQQNETWKALRGLSQSQHACVIVATQASASAYGKENVGREDFSEDKRKYAHVTSMFSLNQTAEEKTKGIMRIAPMVVREDDFDINYNVKILQCLQIGRPYLASY